MEDKSEHCASEESNEEPGGLDEAIQGPNSVENLECMLCHKFIMSRIKGKV
jgi:hypothetical protein